MMRTLVWLLVLGGCDYVLRIDRIPLVDGGAARDGDGDGDNDSIDALADAPAQTDACAIDTLLQVVVDADAYDPALSPDKLQLYVARRESNVYDLRFATRGSPTVAFDALQTPTGLSSASNDVDPNLWGNGQRISFVSLRSGARELYQATRADTTSPWSSPTVIATGTSFEGFDITPDGLTMYADNGGNALVKMTRGTPTGAFGAPATIYSGARFPSLTADQLTLYYHRSNVIYRATRASLTGGFSNEERVIDGLDPNISDDGTLLVFKNADGIAQLQCQ